MRMTARKSTRVKSPVYHLVISWHKNEAPSRDLMSAVADTTIDDLGLAEYQRVTIAHNDTDHRHVHIVVNRVHPETGKAWNRRQDYVAIEQSLRRQSESYGLEFVPGRHNTDDKMRDKAKRARDGAFRQAKRLKRPVRSIWTNEQTAARRETLGHLFEHSRTWEDLTSALADTGHVLERKGQGMVLTDGKSETKLSKLGVRYIDLTARFGDRPPHLADVEPRRQTPSEAPPLDLTPSPDADRRAANHELSQAQDLAEMAFDLHKMGIMDRKSLAKAVQQRDLAKEAADVHKGLDEKVQDDLKQALGKHPAKTALLM